MIYRLIGRAVVVALSFFLAVIVAAVFFTLAKVGREAVLADNEIDQTLRFFEFTFVVGLVAAGAGRLAVVPALAAIIATEAFRLQSLLIHMLIGITISIGGILVGLEQPNAPPDTMLAAVAAGAVGGFVYWILAGRWAGNWRGPSGPRSTPPLSKEA
ncbi:MAG: hypothetical protein AAGA88_04825 [Pseudomonadota bacterium]